MSLRAHADLSADRKRIEVRFPYSPAGVVAIRSVPGTRWSPSKRAWTLNLSLTAGARLREEFGAGLRVGPELRRWGKREIARRARLAHLSQAPEATLARLPRELPALAAKLAARPYQSADIRLMAISNLINANEPGTGKTFEVIGAAAEAGLLDRPALTVAPRRAVENTWAVELERAGYPHRVLASEDPRRRKELIAEAAELREPFWLIVIPDDLRVKPGEPAVVRDPLSGDPFAAPEATARLLEIDWGLIAIDEFQKFGLTNTRSQFGLAVRLLRAERLILASGTPMGGKFKRLWAALNWLYPEEYGSWWRWALEWLEVTDNGFGKVVKDCIQAGREGEFQRAHSHHFVRRSKLADLPGCPPKVHRVVHVGMTRQQERQYRAFEEQAEVRISGRRVTGHGILAEWSRLKQFANATQRRRRGDLLATPDSGKLPYLLDALDETGIRRSQPEPGARAIVGTMSRSFASVTAAWLEVHGIATGLLTGGTKDSRSLVERFQGADPAPYVLVMTIQTGGVSLNLEAAGAIHALDESWDPDDMVQFFDRGDRGTRTKPLLCFTYRTRETIQEYIAEVAAGKAINNHNAYQFRDALRARTLVRTRTEPPRSSTDSPRVRTR